MELFDTTDKGRQLRDQFSRRFSAFNEWVITAAPDGWLQSDRGAFDVAVEIQGLTIAVIGLNTAWLSKDDHDRHNLSPGSNILEDALTRHRSADAKIVLGHHPFDWMEDKEAQRIRAILARNNAIYLAGHLHEDGARYEDGGVGAFLSLRSGSAFQGRVEDRPKLVNGLQWGQLYFDRKEVLVQAYHWSDQHREWKLTTDAFPNERRSAIPEWWSFPLPATRPTEREKIESRSTLAQEFLVPPPGWAIVDTGFLDARQGNDNEDKILQYFDGRPPDWSLALSKTIPRRKIASELRNRFLSVDEPIRPSVVTVLGAGGEGKSTAFYQTVAGLVRDAGWIALWRYDEEAALPANFLEDCATRFNRVLVAVDEAHSFSAEVPTLLLALARREHRNVHFFLCSRTIDWRAEAQHGGHLGHIVASSDYQELRLAGLIREDAELLIIYGLCSARKE